MIKSERIAKDINKNIKVWRRDHTRLIVAIDGYVGSGKTTVGTFIAKQNRHILSVHLDDFIKHWKIRKQIIERLKNKSRAFEFNWYRYDELEKLINSFLEGKKKSVKIKIYDYDKNDFGDEKEFDLTKNVLVIDGIFLLHPKHKISNLIDKKIYLDVEFTKADKKRILRDKKKYGKNYLPETHPDNWIKYFKQAYRRYIKKHKPKSKIDLVFKV